MTVITNALNIAIILGAAPGFAVHLPGGQFKSPTLSISGDHAVEYFKNIYAESSSLPQRAWGSRRASPIPALPIWS